MKSDQVPITCAEHGEAFATYICEHLVGDPVQEWFSAYPSDDNRWPDAWCARCNIEFVKQGEWNEKNEDTVAIKLFCSDCYEKRRAQSVNRLTGAALDRWNAFSVECCEFLHARQKAFLVDYEIEKHKRWDWDQDTCQLVFSNDGVPAVIASIGFVGSISTISNTWLWSWANPSFSDNASALMKKVRDFGEVHGFPRLTTPKWSAEEVDGWEMTSIAAHILNARGAYRTPDDTGFTFLVITDVRLARGQHEPPGHK